MREWLDDNGTRHWLDDDGRERVDLMAEQNLKLDIDLDPEEGE